MEKPISLKIEEVKEQIINQINKSGLPAFILEPIIKNVYTEVLNVKNKELELSKQEYTQSAKKEAKNGKD